MRKTVLAVWMVIILVVSFSYAAIQGDFVINGVDATTATKFYRIPASVANGLRVDVSRVSAGTITPIDAFATPSTAITTWSLNGGYNGATWDMLRSGGNNSDAVATATLGYLRTINYVYGWNAASWDRIHVGTTASDTITPNTTGNVSTRAFNFIWNGISWTRAAGTTTGLYVKTTGNQTVTTEDIWHHYLHQGQMYSYATSTTVAGSTTIYFLITAPASTISHFKWSASATQTSSAQFYEDATAGGGTALSTRNRNRNSSATSSVALASSPTVTTDGTLLSAHSLVASKREGGELQNDEWELKYSTKYLIKLTNDAVTDTIFDLELSWSEFNNVI